ncbi:MAG: extracellular solute-binding protein [Labilithrix sp.]|nr:extracellular solute-binding protein [Labilithrix sp.]
MHRLVRLLAALLVVLLGGASLGCAEPERGIVVWHPARGDEQKAFEAVAAAFEAERGVKVTLLAVPYDAYAAKLEAAIPRGNGPDVFVSPHERLGSYLSNHLVAPAGDAFPDEDLARYEREATLAITDHETRYAVPLASKCVALYYNPKLLPEPPATLDALTRKKGTLPGGAWPIAYETQSAYIHVPLLHAFGGQLFSPERETFAMVGPEAERAADKAKELIASGAVPAEASGDLVKQLFASGKAAAVISGPWLAGELPRDVSYAVVPLPSVEGAGKMRPFLTVDGAFLTPQGAKRTEARELARFLGGDRSAAIRRDVGKQIVATTSAWSADRPPSTLDAFHDATKDAVPMPTSLAMRATWVPAEQALRKIIRGETSAKNALEEARARYVDVMRPPPPSPSPAPLVAVAGAVLLVLAFYAVRRTREPGFRRELKASMPAYKYVVHSAITILVLVVFPLLAGATTSFFAGARETQQFVGLANYVDILTARGKPLSEWLSFGSFYLTLLVTAAWTLLNITLHVGIGLVLGVALARPFVRLRAIYRVLLIVPWAVPSYVTALAWKGMFHRQFGAVNAILSAVGAEPVSWFAQFSTAFAANVATNVWLGFPFMMVVVMGALTSIPRDVIEAAEVDGATRWQAFRLVTLPLLKPTLLPAVVLGTIWTFNQFNVVYLVSGGEPDGRTDILVSEAYRWAFARNAQLGYAAAYAVIIFGLLALMTRALGKIGGEKGEAR